MTVCRVMGTETEYGVLAPGRPDENAMALSGRVVRAYAESVGLHHVSHGWDYLDESPLDDARGWRHERAAADPSQLTDEWGADPTVSNVVLSNGARLYVDHAHPEYSAPETLTPRDAVIWDRAGEVIMARAADLLAGDVPPEATEFDPRHGPAVGLYKNNTDGKGSSYGFHENYLVPRGTPFSRIVDDLTGFFVARPLICGAGRVGIGQFSDEPGYQISSRADFFETLVGLETTARRPIINTRDEPHAQRKLHRRLHVIVGDATFADVAGLVRMGATSLVLQMIEAGGLDEFGASGLRLADPLAAMRALSHDPTLRTTVETADGRRMRGLDILWAYYEVVRAHLDRGEHDADDQDTVEVLSRWEDLLTRLGGDVMSARTHVDWVAKLALLEGYRARDGLDWSDPRLVAIDIQWSDVRTGKGLARRLEERGALERLVSQDLVAAAVTTPPVDTRAWFRGECVRRYGAQLTSASWDSLVFNAGPGTEPRRLVTLDPRRGTKAHSQALLDRCPDAMALLDELG